MKLLKEKLFYDCEPIEIDDINKFGFVCSITEISFLKYINKKLVIFNVFNSKDWFFKYNNIITNIYYINYQISHEYNYLCYDMMRDETVFLKSRPEETHQQIALELFPIIRFKTKFDDDIAEVLK